MKTIFIFSFVVLNFLLLPGSNAQNSEGYKIKGFIVGLKENSKVYLINGRERKILDSGKVVSERFLLSGVLSEPAQTYLYVMNDGKQNRLANILLDNQIVTVTGSAPVYDSIKVRGSAMDYQWKEWYQKDQEIGKRRSKLAQVHQSLVKKTDTENAAIVKDVIDDLTEERINLLKSYVKKNYNNASGALFPLISTISDQLTKNDYIEMYNMLTPSIKDIALGKELFKVMENKTAVEVVSTN